MQDRVYRPDVIRAEFSWREIKKLAPEVVLAYQCRGIVFSLGFVDPTSLCEIGQAKEFIERAKTEGRFFNEWKPGEIVRFAKEVWKIFRDNNRRGWVYYFVVPLEGVSKHDFPRMLILMPWPRV